MTRRNRHDRRGQTWDTTRMRVAMVCAGWLVAFVSVALIVSALQGCGPKPETTELTMGPPGVEANQNRGAVVQRAPTPAAPGPIVTDETLGEYLDRMLLEPEVVRSGALANIANYWNLHAFTERDTVFMVQDGPCDYRAASEIPVVFDRDINCGVWTWGVRGGEGDTIHFLFTSEIGPEVIGPQYHPSYREPFDHEIPTHAGAWSGDMVEWKVTP